MGEAAGSVSMNVLLDRQAERDTEELFQSENSLKALNSITKRPPVNILFNDVGYSVSSFTGK